MLIVTRAADLASPLSGNAGALGAPPTISETRRSTMYPANAYVIRQANESDERALHRLAELDGQRPFSGPALIGEIDGRPAAAVSLFEGRLIADPFQSTTVLRQVLRMRLGALQAYSSTPSLPERLRAAMRPFAAAHASDA
jgi:hypothetical protein